MLYFYILIILYIITYKSTIYQGSLLSISAIVTFCIPEYILFSSVNTKLKLN